MRRLALALAETDDQRLRGKIRKKLEVISLLYACKSTEGEEFRKSAGLAVDLSGWKAAAAVKAKARARKDDAKEDRIRMERAVADLEEEPVRKEEKF